jgi:hypothetical protein
MPVNGRGFMRGSAVVIASLMVAIAVEGRASADGPVLLWPSPDFRDLQAAIDAAPDGATLELGPGVFSIRAPLQVKGKRLVIRGAGSGLDHARRREPRQPEGPVTRLVGPPPQRVRDERGNIILRAEAVQGLLNATASDLVVEGLHISGFDAGIVARDGDDGRTGWTLMRDLHVSDTGRGILMRSSAGGHISDSRIDRSAWNGISVSGHGDMLMKMVTIGEAEGAGVYIAEGSSSLIINAVVFAAENGGIVAFKSKVVVMDSVVEVNGKAGVLLYEAQGYPFLQGNQIVYTHAQPGGGWGTGILALGSTVNAVGNLLLENELSGAVAFGGLVQIGDNQIECSTFDLIYGEYQGALGDFQNLGGNECSCAGVAHPCVKESPGFQPPELMGGEE